MGFVSLLLIAPYGVIMDYRAVGLQRCRWRQRMALHRRGFIVGQEGFVPDGAGVAVPFSEGWLLLGSRGADLVPPFYED